MLWVDKYKPKTMKSIVGQQGEKSNANKLKKWLVNWKTNNSSSKSKGNYFVGKEDGSIFKAALLSGPPGVGKTTTATLVCKEVGVEFTEMNASDTRGRKALDSIIKESLSNTSVTGMLQGNREEASNHVLIMDEVDGMAGNEDRGGMQELIQLIKKSKIPIICMCNDRNSPKVRSLANYCFDLRFYKPRVEQIKGFALSVAAKEALKIPPQAMEQIVIGTNQDIRQVLHNLQMWTSTSNQLSYDEAKKNANQACKNIKLGPFDIVKQLFTHSDASKMSVNQKTDLFFTDYSFIPLFIQENYPNVNPAAARGNIHTTLELLSATADAIADGNLIEKSVRSQQSWSLLPLQGYFSTVLPSNKMAGYIGQRIEFPQWLGKNSSRGKNDRILQELKIHMAVSSNCMKTDLNLDYVPTLKKRLSEPLLKNNGDISNTVKDVILIMDVYDLNRQDWESIMDVGKFGKESDVLSKIPTKVKSAFTRLYNKESHMVPYSVQDAAKRTKSAPPLDEEVFDEEKEGDLDNDANEDDDDITKDAMIKFNSKPKTNSSRSNTKKNPNTKIKGNTSKKKNAKTKK